MTYFPTSRVVPDVRPSHRRADVQRAGCRAAEAARSRSVSAAGAVGVAFVTDPAPLADANGWDHMSGWEWERVALGWFFVLLVVVGGVVVLSRTRLLPVESSTDEGPRRDAAQDDTG